jgi:hypothetical protein
MAIIGITELQAVNQMLRAAGEATVSAVGSGNTRDADANTMLDEVAERIQAMGWPENTEENVAHTPAGSGTGGTAISGDGAWTQATLTLVKAGAFPADTTAAGDEIYISGGTDVVEDYYTIVTNADTNTITLNRSCANGDETDVTAAAFGALHVTVASTVLSATPAGPNRRTRFVLNNQQTLYNTDKSTSRLDNDDSVYLDLIHEYTWENLSPRLKHLIVAHAKVDYQRWRKGIVSRDLELQADLAMQDMLAIRNAPETSGELQMPNLTPLAGRVPQADGRRDG